MTSGVWRLAIGLCGHNSAIASPNPNRRPAGLGSSRTCRRTSGDRVSIPRATAAPSQEERVRLANRAASNVRVKTA